MHRTPPAWTPASTELVRSLLARCAEDHEWLISLIESLVTLESPSTDKQALDRLATVLEQRMSELGWHTTRVSHPGAGDLLRGEIGAGGSQVLLLGHMDTVWPVGHLTRMPIRREQGRLFGPGVFDMKAGIGLGLLAAKSLAASHLLGDRRVVFLLSSDEEIGSATSRALIEEEAQRSVAVIVLEPSLPGGAVKTARKGVGEFVIEARGKAAHAGIEPERGANAVLELARIVVRLNELQDPHRGISITVGTFAGGTRSNVVPDRAVARVDVRVTTRADADHVTRVVKALTTIDPRVRLHVEGGVTRPPLERTAAVLALYDHARAIALALGQELGEGSTGGGSDGNFTAALGVPTLDGLGPPGGGAHASDEHVELEPLPWRAALIAGLILRVP
jgi:glutamate carboxypeptidase